MLCLLRDQEFKQNFDLISPFIANKIPFMTKKYNFTVTYIALYLSVKSFKLSVDIFKVTHSSHECTDVTYLNTCFVFLRQSREANVTQKGLPTNIF